MKLNSLFIRTSANIRKEKLRTLTKGLFVFEISIIQNEINKCLLLNQPLFALGVILFHYSHLKIKNLKRDLDFVIQIFMLK